MVHLNFLFLPFYSLKPPFPTALKSSSSLVLWRYTGVPYVTIHRKMAEGAGIKGASSGPDSILFLTLSPVHFLLSNYYVAEATILRAQGPWLLVPGTSKPSGSQNFNGLCQVLRYREKCQRRREPLFGGRVFLRPPGNCYWVFLWKAPTALFFMFSWTEPPKIQP